MEQVSAAGRVVARVVEWVGAKAVV
jgi:hypothetical protein